MPSRGIAAAGETLGRVRAYVVSIIVVVLASTLLSAFEYYFVQADGLPLREARMPEIGPFYPDQLLVIFPILILISFEVPVVQMIRGVDRSALRQTFALGLANFMMGVVLEDYLWYWFRAIAPSASDPFGGVWLQSSDPTATFLGYADIAGVIIPIWYFMMIPPVVAIIVGLIVLSPVEASDT